MSWCIIVTIMYYSALVCTIIQDSQYYSHHYAWLAILCKIIYYYGIYLNILSMMIFIMHYYNCYGLICMILDYYSIFSIWLSSVCIISNIVLSSIHYYAVLFKIIKIIVMMHYCHYYVLFCISMHYYSRFSVLFSSLCMVSNTMQNYLLLWNIFEYSQYDDLHHALL